MKTKRKNRQEKLLTGQLLIPDTPSGQSIIDENTAKVKVEENEYVPQIIVDHSRDKLLKNNHTTFE